MVQNSTIAAVSTAIGGAIALIRLSGDSAIEIANRLFRSNSSQELSLGRSSRAYYGNILDEEEVVDDVILTIYRAPNSYTGEDMVEISTHGSSYIVQRILSLLIDNGAELANRGEFTMRAYLNGKMDLVQAEAVADLISSTNAAQHRLAMRQMKGGYTQEFSSLRGLLLHFASMIELELDFSEEDVEFASRPDLIKLLTEISDKVNRLIDSFSRGNAVKNGIPVCIVGSPNVGKSTLLNRLIGEDRAMVSDIAGTTRDVIEDTITLGGITFRLIDTAGIRTTDDKLESMGIDRTFSKISTSQLILFVSEISTSTAEIASAIAEIKKEDHQDLLILLNKADKLSQEQVATKLSELTTLLSTPAFAISALDGQGITSLEQHLITNYDHSNHEEVLITNVRHLELLKRSQEGIDRTIQAINTQTPTDLIAQDIRHIITTIGEITGEITTHDILGNIFANFCIGK